MNEAVIGDRPRKCDRQDCPCLSRITAAHGFPPDTPVPRPNSGRDHNTTRGIVPRNRLRYAEMSADKARDTEADEWCESLADDGPDAAW